MNDHSAMMYLLFHLYAFLYNFIHFILYSKYIYTYYIFSIMKINFSI